MLIMVAKVVLAELAGGVALGPHDIGDRGHPRRYSVWVSRHADRKEAGAERFLTQNERRTTRRTALLAIGICKDCALVRYTVYVRRLVTHHSHRISTDLRNADVIAKDHKDVRLALRLLVIELISH
jgi:hypothetical protein